MFDPGRYKKKDFQLMVGGFFQDMGLREFQTRVRKLKNQRLMKNYQPVFTIKPELYALLYSFVQDKR